MMMSVWFGGWEGVRAGLCSAVRARVLKHTHSDGQEFFESAVEKECIGRICRRAGPNSHSIEAKVGRVPL